MTFSPAPTGPVAIVFSPWSSAAENFTTVAQSGGRFLRASAGGRVVVAEGDDETFRRRVGRAPHVLLLLDPIASGLCAKDK
jgi:hypothetical protein